MEFLQESQRVDSGALQVDRKRLHFSARVRQVSVADSRRHQTAAFHANLQPAQKFGNVADGIVSTVQAIEPEWMILLVKAFRPYQQMKVAKCVLNFAGFLVHYAGRDSGDGVGELAQRGARRGVRACLRLCLASCFVDRHCSPADQRNLHLFSVRLHRFERRRSLLPTSDALAREQMVPTSDASTPPARIEYA